MSSIIKTGCAPSNTPDGKYFLQTDQACFAELKRGRTYICTAQEEAKVSHYVIITNADFTVTFNGDSDLIQVGRANNAIVMNVHRACRIDFVQGGNLEFKEGTAEFSSRITMGPNASGNVLVAASLPQQGDFAGQICSLTTGATYVWTGSEWSSTAGSSTLPTPTSANKWFGLTSDGSSWIVRKFNGVVYLRIEQASGSAGTYYSKAVATNSTSSQALHFSFNVQFGNHGYKSCMCHFDVVGNWNGSAWSSAIVRKVCLGESGVDATDITYQEMKKLTVVFSDTDHAMYLKFVKTNSYVAVMSITNVVFDEGTAYWDAFTTTAPTCTCTPTEATEIPVPVSTAANQMLVSDGNGGWSLWQGDAGGGKLRFGGAMTANKHYLYKLGTVNDVATSSRSRQWHICGQMRSGQHTQYSTDVIFDVVGNWSVTEGVVTAYTHRLTLTNAPSMNISGAQYFTPPNNFQVITKLTEDGNGIDVFMDFSATAASSCQATVTRLIADEDVTCVWKQNINPAAVIVDSISDYKVPATKVSLMPVPVCTTADNGKVLKVVNGVPAWTSA